MIRIAPLCITESVWQRLSHAIATEMRSHLTLPAIQARNRGRKSTSIGRNRLGGAARCIKQAWLLPCLSIHRPLRRCLLGPAQQGRSFGLRHSGRWPREHRIVLIWIRADPLHETDHFARNSGRTPLITEYFADTQPNMCIGIPPRQPGVWKKERLNRIARRCHMFANAHQLCGVHSQKPTGGGFAPRQQQCGPLVVAA